MFLDCLFPSLVVFVVFRHGTCSDTEDTEDKRENDDDCFYFFPSDRLCSTPKAFRHRHQWDQSKRPSTQIKNKYEITIIRGGQMERFGEGDEEVMRG